ncbi:hypothetical protein CE91St43_13690 [Oscillospiraceae bacterium]|nr:hypothetical protein CE91St43_13690 [Oscillospiraceae bacterium]
MELLQQRSPGHGAGTGGRQGKGGGVGMGQEGAREAQNSSAEMGLCPSKQFMRDI